MPSGSICVITNGNISFIFMAESEKVKVKVAQWCPTLCDPMDYTYILFCPWNSPGQNTGVGSPSLLQGIEPRSPTLQADS